jgi:hypothetical protein
MPPRVKEQVGRSDGAVWQLCGENCCDFSSPRASLPYFVSAHVSGRVLMTPSSERRHLTTAVVGESRKARGSTEQS